MLAEPPCMKPCPRCGAKIPIDCKICWNCGEVLDTRLIELSKGEKR